MTQTPKYTNFDRHLELTEPEDSGFLPIIIGGCLFVIIVAVIINVELT